MVGKNKRLTQVWRAPIITALERLSQGQFSKFEVSLGYKSLSQKQSKTTGGCRKHSEKRHRMWTV